MRAAREVSIVVPVYNSSKILQELVSKIFAAMDTLHEEFELILVDDSSTDGSWEKITELSAKHRKIIGLRLAKNKGQWVATLAGISQSQGKYIVTIDDDLEYDPSDIPALYKEIKSKDLYLVCGIAADKYRLQGKGKASLWRKRLLIWFWNTALTDSFKIFSRAVVFAQEQFMADILIDAYIEHHLDKRYWGYLPVSFQKRHSETSNYSIAAKIRLFFIYTGHYLKSTLKVFSITAMLFAIVASWFFLNPMEAMAWQVFLLILLYGTWICASQWAARTRSYSIIDSINLESENE